MLTISAISSSSGGLRLRAEAVFEIAVKAFLIATALSEFMQGCGVIVTIINEC